ncbi:MAG TPA: polysaccharide deacetylase family protein [Polyangiaceae bacterium]
MSRAPVHVSIHDVSPAFASEIEDALEACERVGARAALLVVPNFHGEWPLADHPRFVDRLRELASRGHEILLHGFFHRASGEGRGLRSAFAQRVASAGEAEFADLARDEGERRLDDGASALRALELPIAGFVAPAWSMARWVVPALASRGFRYAEDHMRVYDPAGGRSRASLVLNFASRTPARLASSALFVRIARPARGFLPTRIALHPGDMRSLILRRETESLLRAARGSFTSKVSDLIAANESRGGTRA